MIKRVLFAILRVYQRYFTLLGYGSCRYYPTCSEYAKWQIETNPELIKALLFSTARILRCNQFFDGGIDYPKITNKNLLKRVKFGKVLKIKYWYIPDKKKKDGWIVIKNTYLKG